MSRTCLWREQEFQSDAEIAPSCSEPVELLEFQLEESEKLSCSELVERFQVTSDNPDISFEKVTKMHRLKWMQDKVHRAEVCNEWFTSKMLLSVNKR